MADDQVTRNLKGVVPSESTAAFCEHLVRPPVPDHPAIMGNLPTLDDPTPGALKLLGLPEPSTFRTTLRLQHPPYVLSGYVRLWTG